MWQAWNALGDFVDLEGSFGRIYKSSEHWGIR